MGSFTRMPFAAGAMLVKQSRPPHSPTQQGSVFSGRTRHASDEICFYRALQTPGPCPELKNNNIRVQDELCLAGEEFVLEVQAAPNRLKMKKAKG